MNLKEEEKITLSRKFENLAFLDALASLEPTHVGQSVTRPLGHSFKLAYLRLEACELKFFHSFLKINPPKNIISPISYI